MPKPKPPYSMEFRAQLIELVKSGREPVDVAREFGVSSTTVWKWVRQAAADGGERTDLLTTDEKTELARLRREVRVLREERDILSKAAAWFAQEAAPTPKKRSDS